MPVDHSSPLFWLELRVPTCVFQMISHCEFLLHLSTLCLCATIRSLKPLGNGCHVQTPFVLPVLSSPGGGRGYKTTPKLGRET